MSELHSGSDPRGTGGSWRSYYESTGQDNEDIFQGYRKSRDLLEQTNKNLDNHGSLEFTQSTRSSFSTNSSQPKENSSTQPDSELSRDGSSSLEWPNGPPPTAPKSYNAAVSPPARRKSVASTLRRQSGFRSWRDSWRPEDGYSSRPGKHNFIEAHSKDRPYFDGRRTYEERREPSDPESRNLRDVFKRTGSSQSIQLRNGNYGTQVDSPPSLPSTEDVGLQSPPVTRTNSLSTSREGKSRAESNESLPLPDSSMPSSSRGGRMRPHGLHLSIPNGSSMYDDGLRSDGTTSSGGRAISGRSSTTSKPQTTRCYVCKDSKLTSDAAEVFDHYVSCVRCKRTYHTRCARGYERDTSWTCSQCLRKLSRRSEHQQLETPLSKDTEQVASRDGSLEAAFMIPRRNSFDTVEVLSDLGGNGTNLPSTASSSVESEQRNYGNVGIVSQKGYAGSTTESTHASNHGYARSSQPYFNDLHGQLHHHQPGSPLVVVQGSQTTGHALANGTNSGHSSERVGKFMLQSEDDRQMATSSKEPRVSANAGPELMYSAQLNRPQQLQTQVHTPDYNASVTNISSELAYPLPGTGKTASSTPNIFQDLQMRQTASHRRSTTPPTPQRITESPESPYSPPPAASPPKVFSSPQAVQRKCVNCRKSILSNADYCTRCQSTTEPAPLSFATSSTLNITTTTTIQTDGSSESPDQFHQDTTASETILTSPKRRRSTMVDANDNDHIFVKKPRLEYIPPKVSARKMVAKKSSGNMSRRPTGEAIARALQEPIAKSDKLIQTDAIDSQGIRTSNGTPTENETKAQIEHAELAQKLHDQDKKLEHLTNKLEESVHMAREAATLAEQLKAKTENDFNTRIAMLEKEREAYKKELETLRRTRDREPPVKSINSAAHSASPSPLATNRNGLQVGFPRGAKINSKNTSELTPEEHDRLLEAKGVKFESDSDSDSDSVEMPSPRSRPWPRDPLWRHPKQSRDLYEVAPRYLAENTLSNAFFEAKKHEISMRPRRKQTWGKVLGHTKVERGIDPHQEVNKLRDDRQIIITMLEDTRLGFPDEQEYAGRRTEEKVSMEALIGMPKNPVPFVIDGQLAFKDGTSLRRGRDTRAKDIFRVGP